MKRKVLFCIRNFEEILSSLTLFVIVVLMVTNVIARNVFQFSFVYFNEIILLCFTWTVFVGASACYKRKMHYGITAIVGLLPQKLKQAVTVLVDLLLLGTFIVGSALAIHLMAGVTTRITTFLQISYRYVNLSAVVGMVLMAVHSVEFLIADVRELMGKPRLTMWYDGLDWEVSQ